jgi:hypothetical protein
MTQSSLFPSLIPLPLYMPGDPWGGGVDGKGTRPFSRGHARRPAAAVVAGMTGVTGSCL